MADFDPTQPFENAGGGGGVAFDPSQPFEEAPAAGGAREAIAQQNAAWEAAKQTRATNPQSFGETFREKLRAAGQKVQSGVDVLRGKTETNEPPEGVMGPTYPGEYPPKEGPAPSLKVPEDLNQNRTG